jgi:Na+/proline symporter
MILIFCGLVLTLILAVNWLPAHVSFGDAVSLAGAAGRLNAVVTTFDWDDRYNVWSGLIGGMFLALAYFGTDQSQVQRYLTGRSVAQSRLSLIFNAAAKIPMQFFVLFIGTIVFVFFVFERPPVLFQPVDQARIEQDGRYQEVAGRFQAAHDSRRESATAWLETRSAEDLARFRGAQKDMDTARKDASTIAGTSNDVNYIFLGFITRYMPAGVVGLMIAVIFAAAMSTISGEVNSLATVTIMDLYRTFRADSSDRHLLWASRLATMFWGAYAVAFAGLGAKLGSLIEAVNIVGSLFYGGMLGAFVVAFFLPRVTSSGAFWGILAGEAAIFYCFLATQISFLWYNVIGCTVVLAVSLAISRMRPAPPGSVPPVSAHQ